ncbi:MAG: carbohydrate kinase [Rhizobiaceae bacterium]
MIICCGEALIDMLPASTKDGQDAYVPHTGGSVFNTAVALGRLGARVGLVSGLSSDLFGRMLETDLTDANVDCSLIVHSKRPTTLAFVKLTDGHASYTFYDENTAGRMLSEGDMPILPAQSKALFCGGISLAVEPGANAYVKMIEREAGQRTVMFDPNIRPDFISDEAAYRARIARVLKVCSILKISDEDLDWLQPSGASSEDKVRSIVDPQIKIVTEGGGGATAYLPNDQVVQVPAKTVSVVDTVGAGDTFNAGLLCFLDNREILGADLPDRLSILEVSEAMQFAHEVAAITVSRKGADPPWAEELNGSGSLIV